MAGLDVGAQAQQEKNKQSAVNILNEELKKLPQLKQEELADIDKRMPDKLENWAEGAQNELESMKKDFSDPLIQALMSLVDALLEIEKIPVAGQQAFIESEREKFEERKKEIEKDYKAEETGIKDQIEAREKVDTSVIGDAFKGADSGGGGGGGSSPSDDSTFTSSKGGPSSGRG